MNKYLRLNSNGEIYVSRAKNIETAIAVMNAMNSISNKIFIRKDKTFFVGFTPRLPKKYIMLIPAGYSKKEKNSIATAFSAITASGSLGFVENPVFGDVLICKLENENYISLDDDDIKTLKNIIKDLMQQGE